MSKTTFLLLQVVNGRVVCMRRIPTGKGVIINNNFLLGFGSDSLLHWQDRVPRGTTGYPMVMGNTGGAALLSSWQNLPVQKNCRTSATIQVRCCVWEGTWQHVRVPVRRCWSPSFKAILLFFQGKPCGLNIILKSYSTDWFCNIFLPEGGCPAFLG